MNQIKINTIIFALVILVIISLFSLFTEYRREKVCTDLAVSEVVRIERKSSRTNTKYRLIIKYVYNYKEYHKTGNYISLKPPYKSHDIVPIKVNPKNPSEYYLSYESRYTENIILLSVGILGIIIGLLINILSKRETIIIKRSIKK